MANRRISMRKMREIFRLHKECGLSQRKIAKALNISRPVVRQYISDFNASGLTNDEIKDMSDDKLLELLNGNNRCESERYKTLTSKFEYFAKELKKTGVTLQLLWEEYITEHPDGYSYAQLCHHFKVWRNSSELTMHIKHKAGDKVFVDFTGKKLQVINRETGEIRNTEVFVGLLGASQLTYVEATLSQKKEDWIRVNENTLHYFKGVPAAIVPDCLKSGVTRGDKYEPDINPEYLDFARHYNTTILPARPNHPKDKALVEGAVKIVYAWIFARLRDRVFFSLKELNEAIWEELERYNSKLMQKLQVSRKQLFDDIEQSKLKPLPIERYRIRQFKRLKVQFNYHVFLSDDKHYYSVPYQYRGRKADIIYTDTHIEVYCNNIRIAHHRRNKKSNGYTTLGYHMPPQHKWLDDWNPEKITRWAAQKGESVKAIVEIILKRKQHPEQGYKVCFGILKLADRYGGDMRLNNACRRALYFKHYSYKGIENILKNGLDELQDDQNLFEQSLPEHENIRGNEYYN